MKNEKEIYEIAFLTIRKAKVKKTNNVKYCKECEATGTLIYYQSLSYINYDPEIPLLRYTPKK